MISEVDLGWRLDRVDQIGGGRGRAEASQLPLRGVPACGRATRLVDLPAEAGCFVAAGVLIDGQDGAGVEIPDIVRARDRELPARSVRASWRLRKPASVILVAAGLFVLRGSRVQILYKRPSFGEIHEDCEHVPSVTYRS